MREHDPNHPETTRPAGEPPRRDAPMVSNRSSSMGTIGVIAGIAIALVVGFLLWNMGDSTTDTASDTTPGETTTGASPKTPPSTPSTTPGTGATPPATTTPPANNAPANQGTK